LSIIERKIQYKSSNFTSLVKSQGDLTLSPLTFQVLRTPPPIIPVAPIIPLLDEIRPQPADVIIRTAPGQPQTIRIIPNGFAPDPRIPKTPVLIQQVPAIVQPAQVVPIQTIPDVPAPGQIRTPIQDVRAPELIIPDIPVLVQQEPGIVRPSRVVLQN
jgi:hypothetical protein